MFPDDDKKVERAGTPVSRPVPSAGGLFSYEGKKAVITGAGRGIGRAIALAFARQGADVALAARSVDELEHVAGEVRALGRQAWVLPTDIGDLDQSQKLIERAVAEMGAIHVLVNNAGGGSSVPGGVGPLDGATVEGFDSVFNLNVRSPLFASLRAAERMIAQGTGGAILNIVSIDGLFPAPTEGLYGAAKAALINLTATMAVEYGRHQIRVNAIAPGLVDTALVRRALATDEQRQDRSSFYPLGRVGQPEDIASAAVYLCSDDAGWTSGETLLVAGGLKSTTDVFRWVRRHNPVPDSARI
jgi:NAD(P)-dependent dehydrogenase (short-subunit alcohol dehydrogenase family)